MMMTTPAITGTILSVSQVTIGDELTVDAAVGATVLTVDDTADFDSVDGGTVTINAAQYVYTAVDDDANTLTLATGLTAAAVAGDRVDVWDTALGLAASEWRALVEVPGTVDNADAIDARVSVSLVPLLRDGLRDPGTGEVASLVHDGGEWVVTDLPGRTPQIAGGLMQAGTIPQEALSFTVGTTQVTVAAVAPTAPQTGDVWIDTSSDNVINQWDGAAWQPLAFGTSAIAAGAITAASIAAGTIEASNLAAGLIVAGVVDGTTIEGAQFIAHGTSGEILVYDGTPAAGNLVLAISAAAGTDTFGNVYQRGITFPYVSLAANRVIYFNDTDTYIGQLNSASTHQLDITSQAVVIQGTDHGFTTGTVSVSAMDSVQVDAGPSGEAQLWVSDTDPFFVVRANGADVVAYTDSDRTLQLGNNVYRVKVGNAGLPGSYYYEEVRLAAQSIPNDTLTTLTGMTAGDSLTDYTAPWNLTTGSWTCPVTGVYQFQAGVVMSPWTAGDDLNVAIKKNGALIAGQDQQTRFGVGEANRTIKVAAGDVLTFAVRHNHGAASSVSVDARSFVTIRRCI